MQDMNALIDSARQQLEKSFGAMATEAKRLQDTADAATGGKFLQVQRCEVPSKFRSGYIHLFDPSHSSAYGYSWKRAAQAAREQVEASKVEMALVHENNKAAIEHNQKLRHQVVLFMASLGIAQSRHKLVQPTARSRKQVSQLVSAGFVEDLQVVCSVSDGYENCLRAMSEFEKLIERFEETHLAKDREAAVKLAAESKEREKLTLLGALAQKYQTAPDFNEIIEKFCATDRYFGLAYWLERNRDDWNDGPSFAETGLNWFTPACDEDEEIYASIRKLIDNWEGDGRVFRDTQYDYGTLYSKVQHPELVADYQKLASLHPIPW